MKKGERIEEMFIKKNKSMEYMTLKEFDEQTKRVNFLFLLMLIYAIGLTAGFVLDINLRYS